MHILRKFWRFDLSVDCCAAAVKVITPALLEVDDSFFSYCPVLLLVPMKMYLEALPARSPCCSCVSEFELEVNDQKVIGSYEIPWGWGWQEVHVELDLEERTAQYSLEWGDWFGHSLLWKDTTVSNEPVVGVADATGVLTTYWELQLPSSGRRASLEYEGYFLTDMILLSRRGETLARVSERGCCPGWGWQIATHGEGRAIDLNIEDAVFVGLVFDKIVSQRRQQSASATQ
eukprot:scaffold5950_cov263-Amphora_coffeaeformis.AAC.2